MDVNKVAPTPVSIDRCYQVPPPPSIGCSSDLVGARSFRSCPPAPALTCPLSFASGKPPLLFERPLVSRRLLLMVH